jgi:hypothetical protein
MFEMNPRVKVSPVPERLVDDASIRVEDAAVKCAMNPLVKVSPVPVTSVVEALVIYELVE